ncbi:glycosyltransferase family 2 protein [Candidatus Woesearchaeota archaeon]|nr:glycosyltransferase family 2 protein [Candidatus Woesearchaeota archaeon]
MVETSVVLLNYNGIRWLKKCLPPLLKQTYKSYEIILLDNGSTDGSMEWIEKHFPKKKYPRLRPIHIKKNKGFTGGNNAGMKYTRGKYVALLSNDTKVERNWLEELVKAIKIKSWNGKKILVAGCLGWEKGKKIETQKILKDEYKKFTINVCGEFFTTLQDKKEQEKDVASFFFVGGYAFIFRKKDFPQPFDEIWWCYGEDTYIGWLARLRGGEVVFAKKSGLLHYGSGSFYAEEGSSKIAMFHGAKNVILNYLVFYEWKNIIRIAPLMILAQLGHLVIKPKKLLYKINAYWWILAHWGVVLKSRRKVQKQRKVSDKELMKQISGQFYSLEKPCKFRKEYRFIIYILNKLTIMYCWLVRLPVNELCKH